MKRTSILLLAFVLLGPVGCGVIEDRTSREKNDKSQTNTMKQSRNVKTSPRAENAPVVTTAQLAKLTNSMSLAEFQTILGMPGLVRPNSSSFDEIVDFDFNGERIMAEVRTYPHPETVRAFRFIEDGRTIQQRKDDRDKKWSEWVHAHQRKTNEVMSNAEDAARRNAAPQH